MVLVLAFAACAFRSVPSADPPRATLQGPGLDDALDGASLDWAPPNELELASAQLTENAALEQATASFEEGEIRYSYAALVVASDRSKPGFENRLAWEVVLRFCVPADNVLPAGSDLDKKKIWGSRVIFIDARDGSQIATYERYGSGFPSPALT
jgi:hypothetical protein